MHLPPRHHTTWWCLEAPTALKKLSRRTPPKTGVCSRRDPGALTFRLIFYLFYYFFLPQSGDKSLAFVIAHEISHSWTGNLVTNRCKFYGFFHRGLFCACVVRGCPPAPVLAFEHASPLSCRIYLGVGCKVVAMSGDLSVLSAPPG